MKIRPILLATLILLTLVASFALADNTRHKLILKDGSVLQGRILSMDDDAIVMSTDFTESLTIPRDQVARIVLAGSDEPSPAKEPAVEVEKQPVGEGTLEIALKGDAVRSSTRFKNRGDRDRAERMNMLHFKVFLDGELIYHDQDDTIEKEMRERGWVFLRNKHIFPPATIKVPAGKHQILIVINNDLHLLRQGEKQSGVVASELSVEDVQVSDGKTTRLAIKGKAAKFRMGEYTMTLLSRH